MNVEEKPSWLKVRYTFNEGMSETRSLNRQLGLKTVCDSAHCPNICECWKSGNATYLILGEVCTRSCRFCAVRKGLPEENIDLEEPIRLAEAVKRSGLRYVVITSVTRDDLPDGGTSIYASTVREIKNRAPDCLVELLIPDLQGDETSLRKVLDSSPDVIGHNVEMVSRLQATIRDQNSSYQRSLKVLDLLKRGPSKVLTKSSLMLGLGETDDEVFGCMKDLRDVGVDILTIGQYLRPSPEQVPVVRYVPPGEFEEHRRKALEMGFRAVLAGPFVRSSYKAHEAYQMAKGE